MASVVQFDYNRWILRYPEFATIPEVLAQEYFTEATIYHRNDGSGPVVSDDQQLMLLNMMTAHVAARHAVINGVIPSNLIGRISSASEGSVSVSTDWGSTISGSQAWLLQTRYGADYWFATAPYRTFHYRPGPRRMFDQYAPYGRRFF